MNHEFSGKKKKKYPDINFYENPSGGYQVVPCGQMDRQTDMTKLASAHKNYEF
jgi:hypothetical protein